MKKFKRVNGITVVALVVTIIILLILSGIAIATLGGENGLLAKTKQAREKYSISETKEKLEFAIANLRIEQEGKGENLKKDDLPKINNNEIDIRDTSNFPIKAICGNYEFSIDSNFFVSYVGIANETIVTYTTDPEGYTNKNNVNILIKIKNTKGINTVEFPNDNDKFLANGQTEVGFDYSVTSNGKYTFKIVDNEGREVSKDIFIDLIDKLEPLDFTITAIVENDKIVINGTAQDSEKTEESTKSGIDYYEYYLTDKDNNTKKYTDNNILIGNLSIGTYEVYAIAYDRAGNSKKSNITQVSVQRKTKMISTGYYNSFSIDDKGNLWTWGYNNNGQIGNGTTINQAIPTPILVGVKLKKITAGGYHCLAIDEEDNLWAWGDNKYGQLGDGTTVNKTKPVKISLEMKFKDISSSNYSHSLAIDEEGKLWAWGDNQVGQLGDGTITNKVTPVKIESETKFKKISVGRYYSLAIDEEGNLWSWGLNSYGQLGDGTTTNRTSPVKIKKETKFKQILAGDYHSLAIDEEGKLWAWGDNQVGQLGDGTTTNRTSPVKINNEIKFKEIAAGGNTSIAIDEEDNLWAWGYNGAGELGDGTKEDKKSPIKINAGTKFKQISKGYSHSIAIDSNGFLWAWGTNHYGELGDGTTTNRIIPINIIY